MLLNGCVLGFSFTLELPSKPARGTGVLGASVPAPKINEESGYGTWDSDGVDPRNDKDVGFPARGALAAHNAARNELGSSSFVKSDIALA